MTLTVRTSYVKATDTLGSRIAVRTGESRRVVPYDHGARDAHVAAVQVAYPDAHSIDLVEQSLNGYTYEVTL